MPTIEERPTVAFQKVLNFLRITAGLIGCNIYDPNFRINWLTCLVATSIVTYFIFVFMTIAKLFHEDWKILLEATCMASSVVQGGTKLIVSLANRKAVLEVQEFLDQLYAEYEVKGENYIKALNESCTRVRKLLKAVFVLIVIPASLMVMTPFVMMLITKRHHLIIQFHFPGIDVTTSTGYFITLGMHSLFMYAGTFGLYAGDVLVIIYLMQTFLFADIFKCKIQDLNAALNVEKRISISETTRMLNDIVQWHQSYMEYTKKINKIFYYIVAVMVMTSGISIIFGLFIIITGDWPGVYPYLLVVFYTLYVYCILGTKIEICNDQFTEEIYNMHWYELTPLQQKIVQLMLQQSQKPSTVYIAGVLPLSVETGLRITKTIYSMFMMMVQFLMD